MKQMSENTRKAWDVYYKNAAVGAHAIGVVIDETKHPEFRKLLEKQQAAYQEQERKAKGVFAKAGIGLPDDAAMAKLCTDMGIRMHTLKDRSDSNLAKLMTEGTNMGIITLLQTLHQTDDLPEDVIDYGNEILKRENAYMESLKQYL